MHICVCSRRVDGSGKSLEISSMYTVYIFFAIFPYAYHLGRFSPNDSVRRIHKRRQRKPGWQAAPPIRWRNPENGWRRFISVADLVIPKPAQRELEEIALLHLNLVGPDSARNITNLILDTLSRLERFPLSGHIPQDKELRNGGYRYVIAGKYICVYRLIAGTVYVYHMAHGASNYPTLFKRLMKEENP